MMLALCPRNYRDLLVLLVLCVFGQGCLSQRPTPAGSTTPAKTEIARTSSQESPAPAPLLPAAPAANATDAPPLQEPAQASATLSNGISASLRRILRGLIGIDVLALIGVFAFLAMGVFYAMEHRSPVYSSAAEFPRQL
jgi:hypothetical protein